MNLEQNRHKRYQRWQDLMEFNPEIIDRLPPTKQSHLKACVARSKSQQQAENQSADVENLNQIKLYEDGRVEAALKHYIEKRAIAIAPEPLPKLSEGFVTGLIVITSAFVFGSGVANLMNESGRENLGMGAGILGGLVAGCLVEYSGKKMFLNRAMSMQYHQERERLIARQLELQKRIVSGEN